MEQTNRLATGKDRWKGGERQRCLTEHACVGRDDASADFWRLQTAFPSQLRQWVQAGKTTRAARLVDWLSGGMTERWLYIHIPSQLGFAARDGKTTRPRITVLLKDECFVKSSGPQAE